MCDTYIYGVGYICNGCKSEFNALHAKNSMDIQEFDEKLKLFVRTEKGGDEPMRPEDHFKRFEQ